MYWQKCWRPIGTNIGSLQLLKRRARNHFQLGNERATFSWEFEISIYFLTAVQIPIKGNKVHRCESSFNHHQWLLHHPFHERLTKPRPSRKCICFPLRKGQRGASLPVLCSGVLALSIIPPQHCLLPIASVLHPGLSLQDQHIPIQSLFHSASPTSFALTQDDLISSQLQLFSTVI